MIVVEGPDGAGKTTLINRLKEDLDLPIAPRVVSKDAEAMVDLRTWVEENTSKGFQPLIFDRHRLISEPIYGTILRDTLEPGFDDKLWLHNMLYRFYAVQPVIIYCLPPFNVVWDNVMSHDDNKIFHTKGKALQQIWALYLSKAATDHVMRPRLTFFYDYTIETSLLKYNAILRNVSELLSKKGYL